VVTTVADHGEGVPSGDRERIFDKFTRLGDHLTRPQQGVGLGLYIVRRSVDAMGGTAWVDDAAGGGAAFSFSLPVASVHAGRAKTV
jgi:signal transduction histidine kinase